MPILTPYSLTFRGGLHLGARGVNLEESEVSLPSDTLFSALLDAWQRRGEDAVRFTAPFAAEPPDPPFLLTSAFPRAGSLRFYPMPLDLTRLFLPATLRERGKGLRGIRYFSEGLLRKALAGEWLDADLFPEDEMSDPARGAALQHGALWFLLDEADQLPEALRREPGRRRSFAQLRVWDSSAVPRVTIDRVTSASTIYRAGRVVFTQGCGLWFGISWQDPDAVIPESGGTAYRDAFIQALALLQHDGLGGERSSGYGGFEYSGGSLLTIGENPAPRKLCYLLSRYHPRPAELPDALDADLGTAYNLVRVAGWLQSPSAPARRRQSLVMLSEGSLVSLPLYPAGDVVEVTPRAPSGAEPFPHPVYRSGLACALAWPALF
jgi:CRISPR-associated protein Csm4